MNPKKEDFQRCLDVLLQIARNNNLSYVDIQAGHLHRLVGGYPNQGDHRIPVCCGVMRDMMKKSDQEIPNSLKKDGATLTIRYHLHPNFIVT